MNRFFEKLLFLTLGLVISSCGTAIIGGGNSNSTSPPPADSIISSWQESLPGVFQSAQSAPFFDAQSAQIAVNNSGAAVIVWYQSNGINDQIFKSERAANGTWTHPASLSDNISPDGQSASSAEVAINDSGIALIIWKQSDGSNNQIFKAERAANGSWSHPASLSDNISPDGQSAVSPQVALNDDGFALITWRQSDGSKKQVFKSERAINGSWTHPSSLSDNISPDGQNANDPHLAISGSGIALIVWTQFDSANNQIFKSERAANGSWTHPASLSDNISPDGEDSSDPRVAINDSGIALITWYQFDGSNDQIFKSERAINGTWSHPTDLNDNISPDGESCYSPSVAINNNGIALIGWEQSDGTDFQIFKSERAANGAWTHPADLNDNISPDGQMAAGQNVAINNDGIAIIAWRGFDSSREKIFKSERATNGTWTHPADLNDNISPDGSDANNPKVAISDTGFALITWEQPNATNNQIFKSERATNGTWTHPTDFNEHLSLNGLMADTPQVAINDNGIVLITWRQSDGANDQIFRSERAANGTWSHPTDLSDSISPDGQGAYNPQVAINNSGIALITWWQSDGLFSRIYKSERSANGTWTNPSSLSDNISPDGQGAYPPQLTINGNGLALITWRQSDGANDRIFKSERAANGTWTHPADLNDNISPSGSSATNNPQVAINNDGFALIAWVQSDGSNNQIFKSERAASGTWAHPADLNDNISPSGQDAIDSQVAINNSGIALITWLQSDGSNDRIFKSERTSSGTWAHPSDLNNNISPNGSSASNLQVAINDDGFALIAWEQPDGSYSKIYKSERTASGTWTHPSTLNDSISPSEQQASYPQVAINSDGDALILWIQAYAKLYGIEKTIGSWGELQFLGNSNEPSSFDMAQAKNSTFDPIIVYGAGTSNPLQSGIKILQKIIENGSL